MTRRFQTLNFLASRTPYFSLHKHRRLNQFSSSKEMTMSTMKINEPNQTHSREVSLDVAENSKAHSVLFDVKEKVRFLSAGSPEMDQESVGSSEETESPRSVGRWRRKKDEFVHSQVLRIREEDSHLGEDVIGESDLMTTTAGAKEKLVAAKRVRVASQSSMDVVFFSRPVLPCSPLGGKTPLKALH